MSRLAKKPIIFPQGVTLDVASGRVTVKGPKGELSKNFGDDVVFEKKEDGLYINRKGESGSDRAIQGTAFNLVRGMIEGVSKGFSKSLELIGVGFRVAKKDKGLEFHIGFSHPVYFEIPQGIEYSVEKNTITISGIDKQLVGEVAANIRKLKKPEPYKGKGIKYTGENIRRKAGKAGKVGA